MKTLKTIVLVGGLTSLGMLDAPTLWAQSNGAQSKIEIPPVKKGHCTDSGLGGVICNYVIPKAILTDEQLKVIQQFTIENAQKIENLKVPVK
jgi:hypothetical protein